MAERIPGIRLDDCNGCNTVLQAALESISQQSFKTLMQELVLTPSRMGRSTFNNRIFLNDDSTIDIPSDIDDQLHPRAPMRHPILSTGLMWSTASELDRFNLAFAKALNPSHILIEQPLAQQLNIRSSTDSCSLGSSSVIATPIPRLGEGICFIQAPEMATSVFQLSV